MNFSLFRLLVLVMSTLFLAGCASPLKIDIVSEVPVKSVDSLVMINSNDNDSAVRRALLKNGFKVKAAPSTTIISENFSGGSAIYNLAESEYGIRHSGRLSGNNPCLTNGNARHYTEYEFELINLRLNEVILFVSKGGWTEWCTGAPTINSTDLYGDLAKELASIIRK